MLEAKPSDLSIMPFGMCANQLSIGRPKMRNGIPLRRRCAATESPYGPAPMIAVLSMPEEIRLGWLVIGAKLGNEVIGGGIRGSARYSTTDSRVLPAYPSP